MAIQRYSINQYNDMVRAKKEGNHDAYAAIVEMGYNPNYLTGTAFNLVKEAPKVEAPKDFDNQDVLDDLAGGMENSEICEKYGISPQKLGSIKKGAK